MAEQKNPRVAEALLPLKQQLEAEREAILAQSAPHHEHRRVVVEQIQALEVKLREIDDAITAIEVPRLRAVGNELAAIARQIGPTITLQNE